MDVPGDSEPNLDPAQTERLLAVGRSLVAELDLETVLNHVLEAARELTGARYAALGVIAEDGRELERFLYLGLTEADRERIGPLPRGKGVLGELIRNPRPLRLRDVNRHPRSYGFPAAHPPMTSFLGTPIVIRGRAYGNLYLTEKMDADEFSEADERLVIVLAEWAGVAIENARLYQGAERRRVELERAVRGLQATSSLSREVGGETEPGRVLELVAKRGRALVEAELLLVLVAHDGELEVAEVAGRSPQGVHRRRLPASASPIAEVMKAGRGRSVELSDAHPELAELGCAGRHALIAPLTDRGRSLGALLAVGHPGGGGFEAGDELSLASFAATGGSAIAGVQAIESEKRYLTVAASERERGRWARELHDETLQELGALKVLHESALQRSDPDLMRRTVERASAALERTIGALDRLIADLRPAALDELGVVPALEALVERAESQSGLDLELRFDAEPGGSLATGRHPPELETTIYRLVQESLNNVIKHARASRASISIAENRGSVRVEVRDDGVGFETTEADGRYGLAGMRERASIVGGRLTIASEPGGGTIVRAILPTGSV